MIIKHARPAAVMLSIDDLESLEETLDSAALLADIREPLAELQTTAATVLTKDEASGSITPR